MALLDDRVTWGELRRCVKRHRLPRPTQCSRRGGPTLPKALPKDLRKVPIYLFLLPFPSSSVPVPDS